MAEWRGSIRARPGASRTRVGGSYGPEDRLVVAVQAPAVDGRANSAVLAALADALRVRRRQLSLVSGETGRNKVIQVQHAPPDIDDRWRALLGM